MSTAPFETVTLLLSQHLEPGGYHWGMTANSHFQIAIVGNSQDLSVPASTGVWADNFSCQLWKEPELPLTLSAAWSSGILDLSLTSEPGARLEIQITTNLASSAWTTLTTITNVTGRVPFTDGGWAGDRQRFYRALQLP